MTRESAERVVMQRSNERSRVVINGCRTDDGSRCALLVVRELGRTWGVYPHGAAQLGARIPDAEAQRLARAILDAADEVGGVR